MPIAAIYGPVNDQCLLRLVGYQPSRGFTGTQCKVAVRLLKHACSLSINKGQGIVRLDSVNIGQPHQTNYTQRYALCKTSRTTLSTLSQERFSPWRTM